MFLLPALLLIFAFSIVGAEERGNEQQQQRDPLQPLATMLTESVLITRGDAEIKNEQISKHIDATRNESAKLVAQFAHSPPEPYDDDIHLHGELGEILSIILETARHFLEHGDKHTVHHICRGLRLMTGELRSRNGVVTVGDMMWRYNCAFHPMMHEIMHQPADTEITPAQLKTCQRTIENAELALAALEAVAASRRFEDEPKLRSLVSECKASLDALTNVIKREQHQKVKPSVKHVRKCFINLATYEMQQSGVTKKS